MRGRIKAILFAVRLLSQFAYLIVSTISLLLPNTIWLASIVTNYDFEVD